MRRINLICCSVLLLISPVLRALPPMPSGPITDYTRWLEKTEAEWKTVTPAKSAPFTIQCFHHPDHSFYIGSKTTALINAPLSAVEKVVDNVNGYNDIFFGFEDIKKTESLPKGFTVFWHRAIPVPFIPDLRYEVVYQTSKDAAARKTYRYQMKEKIDLLKGLDGLIVLEAAGPKQTQLTQFLFLDGRYGVMQTFSPGKIWGDAIRDVYLANLGIKLRAENPELNREKLRDLIQKTYKVAEVNSCIEKKSPMAGITGV